MLVLLALLGVALLFAGLWLEHRTAVTLPVPTGPFATGRTTCAWVNPAAKRDVLAWIWYPVDRSSSAAPAEYLPYPWRMALAQSSGRLMSQFLTKDLGLVQTHSSPNSPISTKQATYPVVIMRAGGGALTIDFTTLAENLASHGYVVAGFDAPYRTVVAVLPDGRVILRSRTATIKTLLSAWTEDTRFFVDQLDHLNGADSTGRFTGHLDMGRLGMLGYSFGGATALQFCHEDPRCKAGIDIDGAPYGSVVKEGLTQPFLFLLSDHGDLSAPEARAVIGDIRSIYDRRPNGSLLLSIRGANHFSFSDQMLVKNRIFIGLFQLFQGGLDGRRGLAITNEYVHTFFDVYLKGAPAGLLDNLRKSYPEVQRITR